MSQYAAFVAFAAALAFAPGPDSLLTLRNTVAGGRARGFSTLAGISAANAVQGVLVASGLSALLVRAEQVFLVVRWAGVAYLCFLGVIALRAAWRHDPEGWSASGRSRTSRLAAFRQGFLCNITNPKVLMFNLAVLPQFVGADARLGELLAYAFTLMLIGTVVLVGLVLGADAASRWLRRTRVRRLVDAGTGLVMLGFAGALATER
ncbi:LysE family translocator [Luteipulveratus sp. YIM 133132]|uniref:LysE family translocator n=1 Tax=Luteipulveratus flavus TaxID=3031728 RepID=A0ABT6C2Y3_9MICO|nr:MULTISPECIES: LysE family translocator [unclassified Luteipulveratus]MDE9367623.1 LysE family translocator [Luteipulveratus sp. YIM 133132]MDF8263313.1 LysE family translocator [Luteipulveratus sp. YIM 133296]